MVAGLDLVVAFGAPLTGVVLEPLRQQSLGAEVSKQELCGEKRSHVVLVVESSGGPRPMPTLLPQQLDWFRVVSAGR